MSKAAIDLARLEKQQQKLEAHRQNRWAKLYDGDEIMTANEVASLLHMHLRTVYAYAESGKLPATKIGRTWRFSRRKLMELF